MGLLSIGSFFVTEFFDRELPAFVNLPNSLSSWDVNRGVGLLLLVMIAATGFLTYRRNGPERLPRALFGRKIYSPDAALTLSELALKHTLLLRFALHDRLSGLRRCLLIAGEPPLDLSKKTRAERKEAKAAARENREKNPFVALKKTLFPDFSEAKFYLDEERADEIERRYAQNKGFTLKAFAWTVAVCVVLFFVLCRLMPSILQLIDSLLG